MGVARTFQGNADGLADLERAVRVAREAGDFFEALVATNNLYESQLILGRVDDGAKTLAAFRRRVMRFGTAANRRWFACREAEDLYARGRWDEALVMPDEDVARAEAGSPFYLDPNWRALRALVRMARGDLSGASKDGERGVALALQRKDPQILAPTLAMRARVLLAEGRSDEVGRCSPSCSPWAPCWFSACRGVHRRGAGRVRLDRARPGPRR